MKRFNHVLNLGKSIRRHSFAGAMVLACAVFSLPAYSSFLPIGFFDRLPRVSTGQVSISANYLSQNSTGLVIAEGQVDIDYLGYFATADKLVFNQKTKDLTLIGNVIISDPDGIEYKADKVELSDQFKIAVLQQMVMITPDGAMITADKTDHDQDGLTILEKGTYAPCGTCIDDKGRRIGWRIRTKSMLRDQENSLIDLDNPVLEILGIPVAWFPWIRLPDPSNPRANGFRMPSYFYSDEIGLKLDIPYFYAAGKDTDVIITPAITSNQGPLFGVNLVHRFSDWGKIDVTASGLYQFNKGAFAGTVGDLEWRGAIQTSGEFIPADDWKIGWSYSAFTDAAFLSNYNMAIKKSYVNEVYAQYLTSETYANIRVQDFTLLGNYTQADQDKQASTIPNARVEQIFELENDNGRIALLGNLLGINRVADSNATYNGVPYIFGYGGNKIHGTAEASWTKQFETDAGLVFTPYLALRADAAYYDGASALLPISSQKFTLTPIAAIDVRYPLMAIDNGSTHLIEPIAQLVYRGSNESKVGIINDNAQSFVFDDSKLFSYNRFSGTDRQETGLRANVGIRYQANFVDGSYISFLAGQSYFLSGVNSLGIADTAQAGTSTGLGVINSDIVVGIIASPFEGAEIGAKAIIDPTNTSIKRAALAASLDYEGWKIATDYSYIVADPLLGSITDQHSIGGSIHIPIDDYWYSEAALGYNITTNAMINHRLSIGYDDGYFALAGIYEANGDFLSPTNQTYKLTFNLKGPNGKGYGF